MALVPGVFELYKTQVAPMMAELGLSNKLSVPKLKKSGGEYGVRGLFG